MRDQLGIPDFMGSGEALRRTILEWTELVYQHLGIELKDRQKLISKIKSVRIYGWNVVEIAPRIFIETYVLTDWANAFSKEEIIEAGHGYCFGMRDHFAILYTGDVVLCCLDFDGRTAIGNIGHSPLVEILSSPELERILKGFRTGRLVNPYCRRCLGSSSRLGALIKPVAAVMGLKVLKPLFYRTYRLFE
jgi:hypothetical protein